MRKKLLKKINDTVESAPDFQSINKCVDYEKYEKKKGIKLSFISKPMIVASGVFLTLIVVGLGLFIDAKSVRDYNKLVKEHNDYIKSNQIYVGSGNLHKVDEKTLPQYVLKGYKESLIDKLDFAKIFSPTVSKDIYIPTSPGGNIVYPNGGGYQGSDNSSYGTNVQVDGIDEIDLTKCDGDFIYHVEKDKLFIHSLETRKYITKDCASSPIGIYVEGDYVVLVESQAVTLYQFDKENFILSDITAFYSTGRYVDSRLEGNYLYYISREEIDFEEFKCPAYYDGCSPCSGAFIVNRLNIKTGERKKVANLNDCGNAFIYQSKDHIFIITNEYYNHLCISIFDNELEPVGFIKDYGNVLNQYSLDEYDGTIRVVSTINRNDVKNCLSVYSIDTLERIGYLDECLGLERQTVRSVRFDKDICYVCTYATSDPLYEISLVDKCNPYIVSQYASPGYSSYLHPFEINGKSYLLGYGFVDGGGARKISVYEKTNNGTVQIGNDVVINGGTLSLEGNIIYNGTLVKEQYEYRQFFFYLDESTNVLYFGGRLRTDIYYLFAIDPSKSNVITSIKNYEIYYNSDATRGFLVNGTFYIIDKYELIYDQTPFELERTPALQED